MMASLKDQNVAIAVQNERNALSFQNSLLMSKRKITAKMC